MAQTVYKNDSGQIMFGNSGNVFCVPYDFKKATNNRTGIGAWLKIAGFEVTYPYTLVMWVDLQHSITSNTNPIWAMHSTEDDIIVRNTWYYGACYHRIQLNYTASGGGSSYVICNLGTGTTVEKGKHLSVFRVNSSNVPRYNIDTKSYGGSSTYMPTDPIDEVWLGAGSFANSSSPSNLAQWGDTFNRTLMYNRYLSTAEILYMLNNGSGRDPLTKDGLVFDIYPNKAESLDFSADQDGSDMRCGIRDNSGNLIHAQIMGIADGTVAEQVEYSNTSVLKNFID